MDKNVWRTAGATALYLSVHSLLAGRGAKRTAERLLGERGRNGLYRALYAASATAGLVALLRMIARSPGPDVYRAPPPWSVVLRVGQGASLVYMAAGITQIGLGRFLGVSSLFSWLRGAADVPREPEAQGPALGDDGRLRVTGPFRSSRHPLNFAQLCVLWLSPRMTACGLTFNVVVTLYTLFASRNEETRLRDAYGQAYREYERAGAGYLLPARR